MTISPTRGETGTIICASSITYDNNDRKQAQQLLIRSSPMSSKLPVRD
jgi:hypothetical protein